MRVLREMGWGVVIAVASLLLVLGGIGLSISETSNREQPLPSPLPPVFATSIENVVSFTPIISITDVILDTPTFPSTATATLALVSTNTIPAVTCTPPAGWIQIVVGANDTLYTIAERYKTTTNLLNSANCLNNNPPSAGATLYVPPVPTVTVIPCGPYAGWVKAYTVQPGDNLYRISLLYRTTVEQLQRANCMGASTTIYVGQVLWVPNVPTSTPGVTNIPDLNTQTPSATSFPTQTFIITETPLPTDTFVPTETPITSTP
jgi:LysM repeat protein